MMKLKVLMVLSLLSMVGCATSVPSGKVIGAIGSDTFHVHFPAVELKAGDKVQFIEMKTNNLGEMFEVKREVIGAGKVSKKLNNSFYEINSETNLHIPANAFVEKY